SLKLEQHEENHIRSNETTNNNRNVVHITKKINLLTQKSILYFYRFLNTFNEFNVDKSKKIPETIDNLIQYPLPEKINNNEEYIKPILTAYMMIGKLHTKLVYNDVRQRQQQWLICEKYYSELKSYLDRNVEHCEKYFQQYYTQLLELLDLLPIKIRNIQLND
ncbi:hypothetical protein BLA29_009965, partial [Euroglyphus maynei]